MMGPWLAIFAGLVPLARAVRANRRTSLRDATLWATRAESSSLVLTLRIGTALMPWIAMLSWSPRARDPLTRDWRRFRDRLGFVWGERTREQFNRAAEHAGLTLRLGWFGVRGEGGEV